MQLGDSRKRQEQTQRSSAVFRCRTCSDTGSVQLADAPVYENMPMDEYIQRCLMPCPLGCEAGRKWADDFNALYGSGEGSAVA